MNLAKFWSDDKISQSNAAFSWYFKRKKCLVQFGQILFAVKSDENSKNSRNSIWISLIFIQEYMQKEEYVQFGLISMEKVHMGHVCMWVL